MSFFKITKSNTDTAYVRLHPSRSFSSSSAGVTGSVRVIAQSSDSFKEVSKTSPFVDSPQDDSTIEESRKTLWSSAEATPATSHSESFEQYLSDVTNEASASRQQKHVEVLRFTPTNTLTSDSIRKNVYRKTLLPHYQVGQPSSGFNFTNYQCFNFVSSSAFLSASSLVYPDTPLDNYAVHTGFAFSFNIKIKADAGNDTNGNAWDYPAGCVMFRSSSYALSIITGSQRTDKGNPLTWRVMLQLSGAVDQDPSTVDITSLPEFTFLSSDNVLKKNHWHNVAVTWGKDNNSGTGSFYIDGNHDKNADFTLGTININTGSDQTNDDYCVMLGARFAGLNTDMMGFFNSNVSSEGVYNLGGGSEPFTSSSVNRLNAEIHDVRIHSNVLAPEQVATGAMQGLNELPPGLVFYVPGLFVKESPSRLSLLTPFQQETTGTAEPFNVKLSYGVDGRDINIQNYVREFVQKTHPRLSYLTASTIDTSTGTYNANSFLLDIGDNRLMHRAREMFVLPCDNGKFVPGWELLKSGTVVDKPEPSSPMSRFVNDLGMLNYSIVSLNNMISTSSIFEGLIQVNTDGSDNTSQAGLLQQIMGSSPEDASVDPGSGYTILQRTRDNSSNEVVFFDASNLFYGNRIEPGTFQAYSQELSGTAGALSMRLRDNGEGGVYRADAASKHATFARVGDMLYEEGIVCVAHPCIPFYGKNNFSIDMQGDQNIHVYEVNVPALAGTLNSSSNPQYSAGTKNDYASDYEGNALTITSILFHDENFNIVARTNLAQPILKTEFDKYMFRVKFDF